MPHCSTTNPTTAFWRELLEEVAAANDMIREGLPKTTLQVGFRLWRVLRHARPYTTVHA